LSEHPSVNSVSDRIEVQSSRLWALLHGRITESIFCNTMAADAVGVSLVKVTFWMTPWMRGDEHLPLSHIAEVTHDRGLIWDKITVESSGGLNPLIIEGLPKGRARDFVAHVRTRINAAPKA
jgi:hypothetical protein